ncbi:unnamed protein product, partial [Effrenium voratum]
FVSLGHALKDPRRQLTLQTERVVGPLQKARPKTASLASAFWIPRQLDDFLWCSIQGKAFCSPGRSQLPECEVAQRGLIHMRRFSAFVARWSDAAAAMQRRHAENQVATQAIITNPGFPKGHNNLACALVLLGLSAEPMNTQLVQQGIQAAEQAITMAPHVPLYWRNAAVLLNMAGDQHAAVAAWERFRQGDPRAAAAEEVNGIPRDCTWQFYFR